MTHEDFYKNLRVGRCNPCECGKWVSANGGFSFLGCYHEPYHGKWVVEIKDCPKIAESTMGQRNDDE